MCCLVEVLLPSIRVAPAPSWSLCNSKGAEHAEAGDRPQPDVKILFLSW